MDGRVLRGVVAVAAFATCADASADKCDNSTWIQKANLQAENILLLLSGESFTERRLFALTMPAETPENSQAASMILG